MDIDGEETSCYPTIQQAYFRKKKRVFFGKFEKKHYLCSTIPIEKNELT